MLVHLRFLSDIADSFKALASLRDLGTFGSVVVGDDAGDVLVREGKHLRQQVVLVEVLHIVDRGQRLEVVLGYALNLSKDPLILDETCPEFGVVVGASLKRGRLVHDLDEVLVVLQSDGRPTHEEIRGDLRGDPLVGKEIDARLAEQLVEDFLLLLAAVFVVLVE